MENTTTETTTTQAVVKQPLHGKEFADKLREERLAKLGRLNQNQ
jgi:hypothetical protein